MPPTYVGFWPRVWASILDTIMLLIVIAPIAIWIYGADAWLSGATPFLGLFLGWADLALQILLPAAIILAFWVYRRATPGKMAIHARIVDARTGDAPSTKQLIIRYIGYYVSLLPLFAGYFMIAFDAKKQGLHDKMAGTVVVRNQ